MDNYIVLDLEWNQSADGKEGAVEHFPFEIIEIGAVKLNGSMEETDSFHRLIRPVVYTEIHSKISEVTHLEAEVLEQEGGRFPEIIKEFIEWCGNDAVFCTWGSMDLTELQRNMAYFGVEIPFPKPFLYYDVQKLYSLLCGDGKAKQSLDVTVEELGILEDRPFHRAFDDAHYTGRVMAAMDFGAVRDYWSVDYYRLPKSPEEEIYLVFPTYSKYVSRTFETKEDAIADKTVTDLICCRCNRMLRKKIRWFSVNQKFYFALGICPEHDWLKGKIRMKRSDDGKVYVVKTMKLVDEEGARQIYEKKEEARKKRVERTKMKRLHKKETEQENKIPY